MSTGASGACRTAAILSLRLRCRISRRHFASSSALYWQSTIHCVSKIDTDVAHYNFNVH